MQSSFFYCPSFSISSWKSNWKQFWITQRRPGLGWKVQIYWIYPAETHSFQQFLIQIPIIFFYRMNAKFIFHFWLLRAAPNISKTSWCFAEDKIGDQEPVWHLSSQKWPQKGLHFKAGLEKPPPPPLWTSPDFSWGKLNEDFYYRYCS